MKRFILLNSKKGQNKGHVYKKDPYLLLGLIQVSRWNYEMIILICVFFWQKRLLQSCNFQINKMHSKALQNPVIFWPLHERRLWFHFENGFTFSVLSRDLLSLSMFVLGKTWHPRDSKMLPDAKQFFWMNNIKKSQISEGIYFRVKR